MALTKRQFLQSTVSVIAAAQTCASMGYLQGESTQRPPIRIGQIGLAHGHANKIATYRESSDYEVVGIVEENDALFEAVGTKPPFHGIPRMSREKLLSQPGLEAVLIESEISDLLRHAQACVEAGLHIHLDKPAGESLSDFAKVLREAEKNRRVVQLGYMFRYNPAVRLLRTFLDNRWLGEIFEVHAVMSKQVGAPERLKLERYPGGMMFELGCHLIDLVVGILGEPTTVRPFKTRSTEWNDTLWDNMLAVFEYPHAIATVKSSCLEVDGGSRRHLVVCGTRGTFHIEPLDNPKVRLTLSQACGDYTKGTQIVELPKYRRYVDDAAEMASAIRGEIVFPYSYEHDLAVQRTVLKASGVF